ncbi:hypothetical protein D0859_11025 [Hortaea werneckii]|uniref:Cyclase n=1 Tax=Hortaea werneckii TaxID=91943 RepID=A0A3M7IHE3_HORWE|nr:hypothetical protein D0859_11025 [Hortaea werneckii]
MSRISPSDSTSPTSFDELPLDKNGPHGNAWGKWGSNDQIGTLNFLTEDVVAKAARDCILTGERVSLNWSLEGPKYPRFARKTLSINTINKAPEKHAHDDEGCAILREVSSFVLTNLVGFQFTVQFPVGRLSTLCISKRSGASISPGDLILELKSVSCITWAALLKTLQSLTIPMAYIISSTSMDTHIASKGIAGRAVFVDWYAWALEQGKDVDVTTPYAVPFSEILEALHRQGLRTTDFSKGDILIIRFGYLRQYADMGDDKRARLNEHYKNHKPDNIGIEPSKEFLQFLWDTQIAAVAGDTRSFEVWPCSQLDWHLHEWLLAGWGMPIGELFDLEELAKICASTGRYTFFLSSAPMNAPGAVASPPNALAFF